ncbi:MAG TPA: gliding motility-associated C-terminal domain-containing protein, partial [Cytophagaceae bacterium]
VNSEQITYPCLNIPPVCTQDISLSLPGNTPLSGNLSIPNVTTTVTLDGKDLVATGSDVYVDASLDVIQMLSYLPPPAGSVFAAVSGGIQLPPGGIPDFGGTRRYLNIDWTLFTMHLGFPISQNQEFRFSPKVNLKLDFPVETEYLIKDNEKGTSVSGKASTVELPVGADLTIRYPCDYAFMDIKAAYAIDRTGDNFSNRTYDRVDVELIFSALEFAVSFDKFDIIPRTCISIPFVGKFCIELSLPGFSFPIGPLVQPPPIHLAGFDFPPYFNDRWNLGGFSEIPIPDPFRITPRKFRINTLATNVSCFGESGGSVAIEVTGATEPLSYLWSDGSKNKDLANAPAGKYYVAVKDKNGCRVIANTEITQPSAIVTSMSGTDLICHADNSGTAMVTAIGGVPGYSYLWEFNSTGTSVVSGLPAGTHRVTVTDMNGCKKIDSITLKEPRPIRSSIVKSVNPSCAGYTDGKIYTDVSGGVEPYSFLWSGGQTTPDIIGIGEGTYSLTIIDKHGCTSGQTTTLVAPSALGLQLDVTQHVKCYDGKDAEIQATVTGGTTPYDYHWLNNSVTLSEKGAVLRNVRASVYTLEVTDKNGCKINESVTVTQPDARLTISLNTTNALCYNSKTGVLEASVNGGTPPYAALWSNGAMGLVATGLGAGKYTVEVVDANGCTIRSQGVIVQPSQIKIFLTAEDISCSEQTDGYIKAEVVGGKPPYQYTWSNGVTDSIIQNLPEGIYSLSVSDQSGCSAYSSAEIGKREGECLFIPTAFSPNADGINDTWEIRNIQLYPNSHVKVFNKWGQLLFESSPYTSPWDGTYNGEPLPPATYYCVVDTGDGKEVYSGPLTIVK